MSQFSFTSVTGRATLAATFLAGLGLSSVSGQGLSAVPSQPQKRPVHHSETSWVTVLGAKNTDAAQSIASRPQGGSFVAGRTQPDPSSSSDAWVARLSDWGQPLWQRSLPGAFHEETGVVLATEDGGCLAAGWTASYGAGGFDGWVARFGPAGKVLWQRTLGGKDDDRFLAAAPSPDGFYLGGVSFDPATGNDAWVVEIDDAGKVLWQQRFPAPFDDTITSVSATPDGGLVFCALSNSTIAPPESPSAPSIPFFRPWVVKLTGDGVMTWEQTYNFSGGDSCNEIVALDDGGYVMVGEILAASFFGGDAWVLRLDAAGGVLWDTRLGDHFGILAMDRAVSVRPEEGGGFAVLGSTATAGAGSEDLWLMHLDAHGKLVRDTTIGGPGFDNGGALAQTAGGALLLGGQMQHGTTGDSDVVVVRLKPGQLDGPGCGLTGPTAPRVWTDPLEVAPGGLLPTPTTFVAEDLHAVWAPLSESSPVCSPM